MGDRLMKILFRPLVCGLVVTLGSAFAGLPAAPWFPAAPPLPKPGGEVIRVADVGQLFKAVGDVKPGGTILLADGRYMMPRYLGITTDGVTLRSESGDRNKVVLDGAASRHGELVGITGCEGVTIAQLTVANVKWNGIKINSDKGARRVRVYDCVIHNVWQRGIKGPAVPEGKRKEFCPRDCRVEYCLFHNDRPKSFADDETDTPKTFNGNYVAGIDVMFAEGWKITDNVFVGLQGRTREGRAAVFLWQDSRNCAVERNFFIDCDVAVALGNPSRKREPVHATGCVVRNNLIARCPETGILACYTKDCEIAENSIFEPDSRLRRLIWVQQVNDGLRLSDNLLIGPPVQIRSDSVVAQSGNLAVKTLEEASAERGAGRGPSPAEIIRVLAWADARAIRMEEETGPETGPAALAPEVIRAMAEVHSGFSGSEGYVAQFGDSITYSMAFWSPMSWDDPSRFLTGDDGMPKAPASRRWRDYIKGARDKGQNFANFSGWKASRLAKEVGAVLEREKPVAAIIMIGTNDVSPGKVPDSYQTALGEIVDACLAARCVPILNTIPPRRGREEPVGKVNKIIREMAEEKRVPLVDYHAACLQLRPDGSWDGTLISGDGVHPSGGKTNDYTPENLKVCGYALRNWLNFLVVRELVFRVFEAE
jgi:lysophospholipase L1-like esterase